MKADLDAKVVFLLDLLTYSIIISLIALNIVVIRAVL